ncbi:MAG: hypothetical protein WCK51_15820 [Armatimonadota bacterium]
MGDLTSTEKAVRIVDAAIAAVKEIESLPASAPLEADAELIRSYHEAFKDGKTFSDLYGAEDLRPYFRRQSGALDFCTRILHLKDSGQLSSFKESLRHFADAGVSPSSPMTDYDDLDEKAKHHTRLLFEFYVASGITINSGSLAEIAGTKDQSQNNPDVELSNCSIEALACKLVTSKNYVTVFNRLMEGAAQIEAGSCSNGLVVLDVRHCVDQELLVPKNGDSYRTFTSEAQALEAQEQIFHEIAESINQVMTEDDATSYENKTHRRGYLIAAQSFAIIETEHGPVPFNLNKARFVPIVLDEGTTPERLPEIFKDELNCAQWIATTPPRP